MDRWIDIDPNYNLEVLEDPYWPIWPGQYMHTQNNVIKMYLSYQVKNVAGLQGP